MNNSYQFNKNSNRPIIWCVGASKGGVGKSLISSSLAISLSKMGHSVSLVDLDFGGANLHTFIGADPSSRSLRDYLNGEVNDLNLLLSKTKAPNVQYIPGLLDAWGDVKLSDDEQGLLTKGIQKLKSQFVILDLGAGAYASHSNFFKMADDRILITTPEPASIESAYRFIESYLDRLLYESCSPQQLQTIRQGMRTIRQDSSSPFSIYQLLHKKFPQNANMWLQKIQDMPIHLVINQTRTYEDQQLGHDISVIAQKCYSANIHYLGSLEFDNTAWQSLRNRRSPILDNPFSRLLGQFLTISRDLVDPHIQQSVI